MSSEDVAGIPENSGELDRLRKEVEDVILEISKMNEKVQATLRFKHGATSWPCGEEVVVKWVQRNRGGGDVEVAKAEGKEGADLVGPPTFTELPNGRFRCVETGHEMVTGDVESYSRSKRCRLGLIDFALSHSKPPLNMFKQDLLCRSKLICKLTGDGVNKSEQHLWKHINGRRFLNKLEQKEVEEAASKQEMDAVNKKQKKEQKMKKTVNEIISEVRDPSEKDRYLDRDSRDHDIGSSAESEQGSDEISGAGVLLREDSSKELEDISIRTKRMSIVIGPSSFASRKKKPKKDTPCENSLK